MPLPFLAAAGRAVGLAGGSGAAGGGLGALAGQIGNLAYAAQSTVGALSGLSKALVNSITPVFLANVIAGQLRGVKDAIQGFIASLGEIAETFLTINFPVKAAVQVLDTFTAAVGGVGQSIAKFVQLASPVEVTKFNMALEDLTAIFGQILTPVMQASTAFVRMFADAIHSVAKPLQTLVNEIFRPLTQIMPLVSNTLAAMLQPLGTVARLLAPVVRAFMGIGTALARLSLTVVEAWFTGIASAAEALAPVFTLLGVVLELLAKQVEKAINWVNRAIQSVLGPPGRLRVEGSSVGAAVRPAQIGSVEDYGRRAQQAAFSLGTAADPAKEAASSLSQMLEIMRKWEDPIRALASLPDLILTKMLQGIVDAITAPARAAAKVVQAPQEAGREAGRYVDRQWNGGGRLGAGILGG